MSHHGAHTMLGLAAGLLLVTLMPAAAGPTEAPAPPAGVRLDDVTVSTRPEGATVHLRTSGAPRYHATLLDAPARLVVDMDATTFGWRPARLEVAEPPLRQVRGSQYKKDVARVVVELTRAVPYTVTDDARGITIAFASKGNPGPEAAKPRVRPVAAPAPAERAGVPVVATARAADSVSAGADPPVATPAKSSGPALVAQALAPAPPTPPVPGNGRLISLDFKDADVVNLLRILAAESGKNIVISDDVKGKMSITLKAVPWEQALDVVLESRGLEKVEKGNVIRIVTREQRAREREAAAKVEEARIKVEMAQAKEQADIRARAAESALKEQEAQQRRLMAEALAREQEARGPLVEETIRLAYADPEEVARTLVGVLGIPADGTAPVAPPVVVPPAGPPFSAFYAPPPVVAALPPAPTPEVLAKGITIRAHRPTNSIFIRHHRTDLERIKRLIRETLDVELPQIKIEARLNEMSRSDLFEIGVQWGGAAVKQNGKNTLVATGTTTQPGVNLEAGRSIFSKLPLGGNLVNLPTLAAPFAGIGFGIIGTDIRLDLALQALESQFKTRSLSRPEIVTVENAKAAIALGSEIPYATVSSAGTQVQFKEAALRLEVIPTVIREVDVTKIKMRVLVEDNSVGERVPTGQGGDAISINKRRVETEVIIPEGASLVVGGIQQRTESEIVRKVPVLGDVPVLGWLFKARAYNVSPDRELVVFITPSVIRDVARGNGSIVPRPR